MRLVYRIYKLESNIFASAEFIARNEFKNIVAGRQKHRFVEVTFVINGYGTAVERNILNSQDLALDMYVRTGKCRAVLRLGNGNGRTDYKIMSGKNGITNHD